MSAYFKKKSHDAFTLIEMLIVLFVLAILILIFVPNLGEQRARIGEREDDAFEQVVVNQIDLYELNETDALTSFAELKNKGYLSSQQTKRAEKLWVNISGFKSRPSK